jgi:uncharacterized membrane protein
MKKLLDLRFIIGAFFLIIGVLLVIYYLTKHTPTVLTTSVNFWSGNSFILFGIGMIALSYLQKIEE